MDAHIDLDEIEQLALEGFLDEGAALGGAEEEALRLHAIVNDTLNALIDVTRDEYPDSATDPQVRPLTDT